MIMLGFEPGRQFGNSLHIVTGPLKDVETWTSWSTYGSHGLDVG